MSFRFWWGDRQHSHTFAQNFGWHSHKMWDLQFSCLFVDASIPNFKINLFDIQTKSYWFLMPGWLPRSMLTLDQRQTALHPWSRGILSMRTSTQAISKKLNYIARLWNVFYFSFVQQNSCVIWSFYDTLVSKQV